MDIRKHDLNDLAKKIHEWGKSKGWDENWIDSEKLLLTHTEISEAYEEIRNHRENTEIYAMVYNNGKDMETHDLREIVARGAKPLGVPTELADIIIRVLHYCAYNEIDIEMAMEVKMAFNETRPYRHGGLKS